MTPLWQRQDRILEVNGDSGVLAIRVGAGECQFPFNFQTFLIQSPSLGVPDPTIMFGIEYYPSGSLVNLPTKMLRLGREGWSLLISGCLVPIQEEGRRALA